jgi:hypothetical protein
LRERRRPLTSHTKSKSWEYLSRRRSAPLMLDDDAAAQGTQP